MGAKRTYQRTDVVVPIYNEEASVDELVVRLRAACPGASLIFVDNASTDRTRERLSSQGGICVVQHDRNLGYGTSLRDGIRAGSGERVLMIDGDLEYSPEDLPAIDRELDDHVAVYGSRLLQVGPAAGLPRTRALGNRCVTALFNVLFRQRLTDLYTGIRGVRRDALATVLLRRPGFEFVLELAARLSRLGVTIGEVPVSYAPRQSGHSKMRHIPEFLKFAYWLARLRLEA